MRRAYQSDLSADAEWSCLAGHLPAPKAEGRPRLHGLREITDAIFYVLKSGCAWRLLPHDFPPSLRGRRSTTTFAPGAWTGRGRGCTQHCASMCGFAWKGTLSLVPELWTPSRSRRPE
jgi:transposase